MEKTWAEETSPWINMDLSYWDILIGNRKPVLFRKKSFLYHQDDPGLSVHIVCSGRVRVTSYQTDGEEKQFYIAEKGCLLGEASCILKHPHSTSAVAIVDTEVYCIPHGELEALMKSHWTLTKTVMQVMCRKKSIAFNQVLELSFTQSIQRVAQMLIHLCNQYGVLEENGATRINIRFTHQDVSSMINTSRVTVSNVFSLLAEEKVLGKANGMFVVLNRKLLEDLASGESELTV